MSAAASPVLPRLALIAIAILAGIGFLYMVKLMHDISRNVGVMAVEMASMSANMDRMGTDMSSLATDVSDMARQVRTLPAMAQDIQQMRVAIDGLSPRPISLRGWPTTPDQSPILNAFTSCRRSSCSNRHDIKL